MNKPTDFNDMAKLSGLGSIKETIDSAFLNANSSLFDEEPHELDDESPIDIVEQSVAEFNKEHALVFVGSAVFVLKETINYKKESEILLIPFRDIKLQNENNRIIIPNKWGMHISMNISEIWLQHPNRRDYQGIVFAPQGASENFYNMFRGFAVQPIEGDCNLYLRHLFQNICCGNNEYYDYLLNWMAHMIQLPWELPGVAIVFRGAQGTGKGVATDELGRLVEPHYIALSSMEPLVGRFTGHLKDKLLVYANEATWGGNKPAEGALKSMITDSNAVVEQKYKDIIRVDSFKRIMVSSNEDWAVPMAKDDRRFFVLDVGSEHKEDHAYFAAIIEQMRNGGSEALMFELMNRDLSGFNVRKIPQTTSSFDIKLHSMNSSEIFMYEYLRDASKTDWDIHIRKSVLHGHYLEWCKSHGKIHKNPASIFGKHLKNLIPSISECKIISQHILENGKRHNYHVFPSLPECKSEFEKACKAGPEIWKL